MMYISKWATYDKEEAEAFAEYMRNKGASIKIVPIAEEFRRYDDPRPVKTKYYIQILQAK